MTDLLPVVPAKAGTHTAQSLGEFKMADDLRNDGGRWLWVPGRASLARDDRGCHD
jgi:hypothetical protein